MTNRSYTRFDYNSRLNYRQAKLTVSLDSII